jgi:hypothetical protein
MGVGVGIKVGVKLGRVMNNIWRGKGDVGEGVAGEEVAVGLGGGGEVSSREKARDQCVGIVGIVDGVSMDVGIVDGVGMDVSSSSGARKEVHRRTSNTPTKMERTEKTSHSMTNWVMCLWSID